MSEHIDPVVRAAEAVISKPTPKEVWEAERPKRIAPLVDYRDELVERLDVGAARIEEARSQGKDVSSWEDHWISLLHRYEWVCDNLRFWQNITYEEWREHQTLHPVEQPQGPEAA